MSEQEWFTGIMEFAREKFLLNGEEPEPMAFIKSGRALAIVQLALDKEYWADVLRKIAGETEGCEAVGLINTGWRGGTTSEDESKFAVMPHDDPKREPVAIFAVKDRNSPTRLWMLPFDQVGDDGPVTWCGDEWKEISADGGEVKSRFLDGVFEN